MHRPRQVESAARWEYKRKPRSSLGQMTAGQAMTSATSDVTSSGREASEDTEVTKAAKAITAVMDAGHIVVTNDIADEGISKDEAAGMSEGKYKW